jgi:hypothetical protein
MNDAPSGVVGRIHVGGCSVQTAPALFAILGYLKAESGTLPIIIGEIFENSGAWSQLIS